MLNTLSCMRACVHACVQLNQFRTRAVENVAAVAMANYANMNGRSVAYDHNGAAVVGPASAEQQLLLVRHASASKQKKQSTDWMLWMPHLDRRGTGRVGRLIQVATVVTPLVAKADHNHSEAATALPRTDAPISPLHSINITRTRPLYLWTRPRAFTVLSFSFSPCGAHPQTHSPTRFALSLLGLFTHTLTRPHACHAPAIAHNRPSLTLKRFVQHAPRRRDANAWDP
jgi:hypothetical protein